MLDIVWLIPVLPLIGFLLNGLFGKNLPEKVVGAIGTSAVLAAFAISIGVFIEMQSLPIKQFILPIFDWIQIGSLSIPFSFLIDPLTCIMLLVITGVGTLIHLYSIGYMHNDNGFYRFFSYLNLFVFFMLLLVMGSNYVVMFIGWEGVGLCSYLLIGFWFKNQNYNSAAKKAFIMNRIGDLGFLLGVFMIIEHFGSVEYTQVMLTASTMPMGTTVITTITLLLFIGAMGKSAQIPLYTWLPDAMAGPTPVSALIHAATMVTAGIYMIARSNVLYTLAPVSLHVIAIIGLVTAVFAATIALSQTDIKKILAYSTVSQLGYMFLGLGVGAYVGAVFHLMTHAFFKALLFLGAGSVIHAMSNEQDIRKMGGLKKALPITFITMLIGTIAIAGIPPLAGFFSKDEILAYTFSHSPMLWVIGAVGAILTAFYMFRMLYVTFYGTFRGTEAQQKHLHESPKSMTIPLIVLAVFSIIGGWVGIPEALHGTHYLANFLAPVFETSAQLMPHTHLSHQTEYILMGISIVLMVSAIAFAYFRYVKGARVPAQDSVKKSLVADLSYNKYYIDELYETTITKPLNWFSGIFYRVFDVGLIDGLVNGVGKSTNWAAAQLRLLQTGLVGSYVFAMLVGVILMFLINYIIFW